MPRTSKTRGFRLISAGTALALLLAAPLANAHHHHDDGDGHADCQYCVYKQQAQAESSGGPSAALPIPVVRLVVEPHVRPFVSEHRLPAPARAPPF